MNDLPPDIIELIGSYVYLYIDPRSDEVFYVGKGKGNRLLQHLREEGDSEKNQRISELTSLGMMPRIELLRYSLSEHEAALVEAAAIDLLGTSFLTNKVAGGHKNSFPRIELGELVSIETAKPAHIRHDVMLITINRLYRSNMTPLELYEATRGVWRVGKNREYVELAMTVFQGIVREVYRPLRWYPAGTLNYETRSRKDVDVRGRWEFEGRVAKDVRDEYVGYSVGKGGQNPIRYVWSRNVR